MWLGASSGKWGQLLSHPVTADSLAAAELAQVLGRYDRLVLGEIFDFLLTWAIKDGGRDCAFDPGGPPMEYFEVDE